MKWELREILETIRMIELEHFDIRTVTMGISLFNCRSDTPKNVAEKSAGLEKTDCAKTTLPIGRHPECDL